MAVTYDDGPCAYTEALLDILKEKNVKATFFVVGSKNCEIGNYYDTLKRMLTEGHHIALHTWSHISIPYASNTLLQDEMGKVENAVYAATGHRPRYMRPPFGDWDSRTALTMGTMGYNLIVWDVTSDGEDKIHFRLSFSSWNLTIVCSNTLRLVFCRRRQPRRNV